jgi:O-antigen/teichoic acid export membrane protein
MLSAIKRTSKDALIYGIGQGISGAAVFFLVPLYTRRLPQSDIGKLGLLSTINSVVIILVSMGLSSAIFRSYYDYEDTDRRNSVINTTLVLLLIATFVSLLLGLEIVPILSKSLFEEIASVSLLWLIILKGIALSFQGIPLAVYRARGLAIKYFVLTLAAVFLKLIVIVYLVVVQKKGILGAVEGDAWSAVLVALLMLFTIRRDIAPATFSVQEASKLLAFGLPLVPADLASMVFARADLFFLNAYTDLDTVGQYNVAIMVILAIQMLIKTPFMLVWTPMLLSVEKSEYANRFYALITKYVVAITGFVALLISLFAKEVIKLIAGSGYEFAAQVLPMLCLAQVLYIGQISVSVGITLKRKTHFIPVIISLVALTTVISNFLLVPSLGMWGASTASLISAIVFALLTYKISQRIYYVNYELERLIKSILVFLFVYIFAFVMGEAVSEFWYLILRIIFLCLSPLILFLWGFMQNDETRMIKTQFKLL